MRCSLSQRSLADQGKSLVLYHFEELVMQQNKRTNEYVYPLHNLSFSYGHFQHPQQRESPEQPSG